MAIARIKEDRPITIRDDRGNSSKLIAQTVSVNFIFWYSWNSNWIGVIFLYVCSCLLLWWTSWGWESKQTTRSSQIWGSSLTSWIDWACCRPSSKANSKYKTGKLINGLRMLELNLIFEYINIKVLAAARNERFGWNRRGPIAQSYTRFRNCLLHLQSKHLELSVFIFVIFFCINQT